MLDAALRAAVVEGADVFGGNFQGWLRQAGIARSTAYRHRTRIKAEGSWKEQSRAPRTSPGRTPQPVIDHILRLRAELGTDNGADTIRYHLRLLAAEQDWAARGWVVPARSTIHHHLRQAGLVTPAPRKRPKRSYRRFCYARPRDCYQIDGTTVVDLPFGTAVVIEVLDDCTRVLVATHAAYAETAAAAIAAIRTAFKDFGIPAIVLSDNGSAFTSRLTTGGTSQFTRVVTGAGARLIHSSPYHPQTCGKVERHHRTFKDWLATQPAPTSLDQLQNLCATYQTWYNTTRRHSAWNKPPQQAWNQAPDHGGPQHLPVQHDAAVSVRTVQANGSVYLGYYSLSVGSHRAGQRLTVLTDGDTSVNIYIPGGTLLGHHRLDPTKRYQGRLREAA